MEAITTNKALAVLGIAAYIFSIIVTATDPEGNQKFPFTLVTISAVASIVFIVMATIRLWKINIIASVLFISISVLGLILGLIQELAPHPDGSSYILLLNVTKVLDLIVVAWVVWLLWTTPKKEVENVG